MRDLFKVELKKWHQWHEKQLEMPFSAVSRLKRNNYMQKVCINSVVQCQQNKIGGPNVVPEVD